MVSLVDFAICSVFLYTNLCFCIERRSSLYFEAKVHQCFELYVSNLCQTGIYKCNLKIGAVSTPC